MRGWWSRVPRDAKVAAALAGLVLLQTVALAAFGLAVARSQRAEAERDLRAIAALSLARGLGEPAAAALARTEVALSRAARAAGTPAAPPDLPAGLVVRLFLLGADGAVIDGEGRMVVPPPPSPGAARSPAVDRLGSVEAVAMREGGPADAARAAWAAVEFEDDPSVAVPGLRIVARNALRAGDDTLALRAASRILERWPEFRVEGEYPDGPGAAAVAASIHLRRLEAGAPGAEEAFVGAVAEWRRTLLAGDLPAAAARGETQAVQELAAAGKPRLSVEAGAAMEAALAALGRADDEAAPLRDGSLRARLAAGARGAREAWVAGVDGRARPLLFRAVGRPDGSAVAFLVDPEAYLAAAVLPLLHGAHPREGTAVRLLTADRAPLDGGGAPPARDGVLASVGVPLPMARAVGETVLSDPGLLDREAARSRGVVVLVFALAAAALGLGAVLVLRMVRTEVRVARMRADFVASVSHELKTPLTSIRMFLETLREGRTRSEEERQECLDVVDREAQRLGRMVERVLEFSRVSAGVRRLRPEAADPAAVLRDAADAFRGHLVNGSCDFRMELAAGLPVLRLDRDAVTEIVLNLLDNAWKYTPATGKRIVLRARPADGGGVRVEVEDNGPGVPAGDRERVFEEFFRGEDPRTASAGGTGLGLALVRRLAEAHGGSAAVESAPGGGSRFVVTLPGGGGEAGEGRI